MLNYTVNVAATGSYVFTGALRMAELQAPCISNSMAPISQER